MAWVKFPGNKYRLTEEQNKNVKIYIELRKNDLDYYENERNAFNAIDNIKMGKIAECIAVNYLIDKKHTILEGVDFKYYKSKNKSWKSDLKVEFRGLPFPVHVKSYLFSEWAPPSFTFQLKNRSNGYGRDKLLDVPKNDISLLIGVIFEKNYSEGTIEVIGKWQDLRQLLRDPIKQDKKGIKTCLYLSDLKMNFEEREPK